MCFWNAPLVLAFAWHCLGEELELEWLGIWVNSLRPRQNRRHFADDIFKCIFLNENVWISINISLKFVPKGLINNIPALVQIMAWRRPGDKPLSEPMMVNLLTHICVTRPQWVKGLAASMRTPQFKKSSSTLIGVTGPHPSSNKLRRRTGGGWMMDEGEDDGDDSVCETTSARRLLPMLISEVRCHAQ